MVHFYGFLKLIRHLMMLCISFLNRIKVIATYTQKSTTECTCEMLYFESPPTCSSRAGKMGMYTTECVIAYTF